MKTLTIRTLLEKLKPFFDDEAITEICVNRPGQIFYEKDNTWVKVLNKELTYDWAYRLANATATKDKNIFSENQPILSASLPEKERVQFIMPPACEDGTLAITIRKPSFKVIPLDEYEKNGFFNHIIPVSNDLRKIDLELSELLERKQYVEFLKLAVASKKTILIAGATGSGKTTFMKALVNEISAWERLITIEDVPELFITKQENYVKLFYPSEAKITDYVNATTLLKSCLRMKPTRILLAELRGAETFDFINVASSGHPGTISSLHAESAAMTLERLILMTMQNPHAGTLTYDVIKKQLLMTIDIIVHVHNDIDEGDIKGMGRHITEIWFDPALKNKLAKITI